MRIKKTLLILASSLFLSSCGSFLVDENGKETPEFSPTDVTDKIVSIEKVSNEGTIETYLITFSDGTTTTIKVTNKVDDSNLNDSEDIEDELVSVTYHLNGGTLPAQYDDVVYLLQGESLNLPLPEMNNYVFTGWYTGYSVNDRQFHSFEAINNNLDLYARYELMDSDDVTIGDYEYRLVKNTNEAYILKYNGNDKDVLIPSIVEYENTTYNVTRIEDSAFYYVTQIESLVIPDSVLKICRDAFFGCSNLSNLTIGKNLRVIDYMAFEACSKIESLYIPKYVDSINEMAFTDMHSLKKIEVSKENKIYDSRDNSNAIIETKTNSLVKGCVNTTIPESVERLNDFSMSISGLKSVFISKNISYIGLYTFFYTTIDLENIEVSEENTYFDSRENCNGIIDTKTNTLILGCKNTNIPEGVTSINQYALYYCEGLKEISIPESVIEINDSAFEYCKSLENIKFSEGLKSINKFAFGSCSIKELNLPNSLISIGDSAFSNCQNLKTVIIGKSINQIGENFFSFNGETNITDVYYRGTEDAWNEINIQDETLKNGTVNIHFNYAD